MNQQTSNTIRTRTLMLSIHATKCFEEHKQPFV